MLSGHIIADYTQGNVGTAKLWVIDGDSKVLKHEFPISNVTVNEGSYSTDGNCPAGDYRLGKPEQCAPPESAANIPYGWYFTPLVDFQGLWSKPPVPEGVTRSGIGAHGGGSDSATPFALPNQAESLADLPTDGCHRLWNGDNATLVAFVQYIQGQNSAADSIIFSVVR